MSEAADRRAAIALEGITYLRVVLVPVIMWLVLDRGELATALAGWLFAFAAVTDFFDGYLARRWKRATVLGNFLDTTADKLLVSGVLIALVAVGRASPWIGFIIVGRELLILGLRGVVAAGGEVMKPSVWGKLKANVQFVAILLAIWRPFGPLGPLYLDQWAMAVAAAVTIASALEYLARFAVALPRSARSAGK
ncbi:MAG: CDP-diacylglycerol--glycerol-3-phosphate 3-phosphatidyltransferase [Actinomycetota bacterium]|nr:MAG: CDP-diacylglycerol--glycerol-3-phosphate 3-phosphatidyltransferase [Actinomycetota bacterium]